MVPAASRRALAAMTSSGQLAGSPVNRLTFGGFAQAAAPADEPVGVVHEAIRLSLPSTRVGDGVSTSGTIRDRFGPNAWSYTPGSTSSWRDARHPAEKFAFHAPGPAGAHRGRCSYGARTRSLFAPISQKPGASRIRRRRRPGGHRARGCRSDFSERRGVVDAESANAGGRSAHSRGCHPLSASRRSGARRNAVIAVETRCRTKKAPPRRELGARRGTRGLGAPDPRGQIAAHSWRVEGERSTLDTA